MNSLIDIEIDSKTSMLDCRPAAQFNHSHVINSANIPASALFSRMHELSRADEKLYVIVDQTSLIIAQAFFIEKKYKNIKYQLWNDEFIAHLKNTKLYTATPNSEEPITYLWRPAHIVDTFIKEHCRQFSITAGQGLDLACGSGRDLVFLAKQGWQMQGLDYNEGSLERCNDLAARHQIKILSQLADLENGLIDFKLDTSKQSLQPYIQTNSLDLICVLRYLHRPLFPALRNSLKPGGVILYQTFMQGCELISRPKNPRFLLAENELAEAFGVEQGFEILVNEVEYLADGRPVSSFLARKL